MLVDDEPLAIERLTDLLARIDDVEVASVHLDPAEALDCLPQVRPDLIMIDVEMPKVDGFDFVEVLSKQRWAETENAPGICFVTAYPQFASDAFDTGALDFLCKPVRLSRLEKTIGRWRLTLAQREALSRLEELTGQLEALRGSRAPAPEPALWVHQRGQMVRLPTDALDWVEAEGEYVRLHLREQSFLFRSSITSLEERLADFGFARIHRSTLVNRARVAAVHSSRRGMRLELESGVSLPVGRKYRPVVRTLQHGDDALKAPEVRLN
jgi:DNA-binding LytR/AlgR family response regulator